MKHDLQVCLTRFCRAGVALVLFLSIGVGCRQAPQRQPGKIIPVEPPPGEWRMLGRDLAFTRYSTLDQINAENAKDLKVAWRWEQANFGPSPELGGQGAEATPIYVDGVLYTTAGTRRAVAAIDPATGETLWTFRPNEPEDRWAKAPRRNSGRGVSFWTDGKGDNRIILVSRGFFLYALDAENGRLISSFGKDGVVDLMAGLRKRDGVEMTGSVGSTTPPTIMDDIIVVGPSLAAGFRPPSKSNTPGDVQAFDVRTGKRLWVFHTIPEDGEPGADTWESGSNNYTGNAGVWSSISADPELGYVYLPVENATNDYYGGHRPGDDLYANSVVCLDIKTGKKIWHYQVVHHDVWDYDNPAAPILADVTIDGQARKILIQNTKQGFSYVFDRVTGEPIWPIEEKDVPQSDVPGEHTSSTQPIPTKPPPYERQGISEDDLVDFTPKIKRLAREAIKGYRLGPVYTPPSLGDVPKGNKGTIQIPGANGGVNWNMSSFDPELGVNFIGSNTSISLNVLAKGDPARTDLDYYSGGLRAPAVGKDPKNRRSRGIPIVKPPWGRIVAVDLHTGSRLWMVPNGDTPEAVKNNPLLKGVRNLPRTGSISRIGTMVTKTLLFAGEGGNGYPKFHAYDKKTGKVVASVDLPAPQTSLPMTYMHDGKQYIVMTVASRSNPAELVALALPDK